MILAVWLAAAAMGSDACSEALAELPEDLSVAWVAPVGRKVGVGGWVDVFRTSDLRRWAEESSEPTLGRLLQDLGRRRSNRDPRTPYVVTVFDVPRDALCRPLADEHLDRATTVPPCEKPGSEARKSPCGYTENKVTGQPGLPTFRVRWRDAAAQGFCVLPAARFLEDQ